MKRMFLMLTLVGGMSSVGLQAGFSGTAINRGGVKTEPNTQRFQVGTYVAPTTSKPLGGAIPTAAPTYPSTAYQVRTGAL